MNSKRRYIYVDSSSGTATSSIPYQSPSPQEALRGRYGNNDCYTFPMTKPSSVGLSEACYGGSFDFIMHWWASAARNLTALGLASW